MNRQLLANWLKTISLCTALVFGAFGQGYAQESEVSIVVFLPQQGAKPGEANAAQAQAISLFKEGKHSLFFMKRDKQKTLVAIDNGIEASFETSQSLYSTYPTIDVTESVEEFQESLSNFERQTGVNCLDPQGSTMAVHLVIEGSVFDSTVDQFEKKIRLLNGWNNPNGRMKDGLSISHWRWDAGNQRMYPTKQ